MRRGQRLADFGHDDFYDAIAESRASHEVLVLPRFIYSLSRHYRHQLRFRPNV